MNAKMVQIGLLTMMTAAAGVAQPQPPASAKAQLPEKPVTVAVGAMEVTDQEMWADQRKWYKTLIGYTRLTESVPKLPNGSLSAAINMEWVGMPDITDPELADKKFMLMNKKASPSDHFTRGTKRLCGALSSMTPGLAHVQSYESGGTSGWYSTVLRWDSAEGPLGYEDLNHWLKGILHLDTAPNPLSASNVSLRVICSVTSAPKLDPQVQNQLIRRTDAMIDRDDILQTFIVCNFSDSLASTTDRFFMTQSYNGLAVCYVVEKDFKGGENFLAPTRVDAPGRAKPDFLVPLRTPSQSGPGASSAVVLLAECALTQKKPRAAKPYMLKSLLMTGAKKLQFGENPYIKVSWSWSRGKGTPKEQDQHQIPLDFRQGAGMLRVDRSYAILQQPEAEAGKPASKTGWSQGHIAEGQSINYFFTLDQPQEFAATLVWHRHIIEYGAADKSLLNDLDLYLYRGEPGSSPQDWGKPVEYSISRIDNVEHVYHPTLPAGKYVLSVVGKDVKKFSLPGRAVQDGESYGLSWQSLPANKQSNAPIKE